LIAAAARRRFASPLPWLAGLLAVYLAGPLLAFLAGLPGRHHLASPGVTGALVVSVETATIATLVIALLGVPLAYLLARRRSRLGRLAGRLVTVPLALPPLMAGILLLEVLGPYTTLGRLFGGRLTDDMAGIVAAQVFVAAPFLVVAARSAFAATDPALDDVAATLGHRPLARFLRVALPEAAPGIAAGLLLSWLRAFGEFGATIILAYHPYSLPVATYVAFSSTGLAATALPVVLALGAAVVVSLLPVGLPRRRRAPRLAAPEPPRPGRTGPGGLEIDLGVTTGSFQLRVQHRFGGRQLAVLGASGAGKTLLLRALAGLTPASGSLRVAGRALTGQPAEARGVGYLPQEPALLGGRDVWRQVTFGVPADAGRAAFWLDRLGLTQLAARLPTELSGGQRRRVGLARALACQPLLLLLDEPFAGLDAPVHDALRRELRHLQAETAQLCVLVTHDPQDVAALAEEVLVLDEGRVLQAGPVSEVFTHPASARVAALLGHRNIGNGHVVAGGISSAGVELPADTGLGLGTAVSWCVAARDVALGTGELSAQVVDVVDFGSYLEVELLAGDGLRLLAHTSGHPPAGRCRFAVEAAAVRVWEQPSPPAAAFSRTAGR
jgi:ABC-type sulfate/molybdate transport systems ATPase subunit/ABC-type sulfate transport system permease component